MKQTLPFASKYKPNFFVVEEAPATNIRVYPHTRQLEILLGAINKEFRDGLPDRLARADHRANGYVKFALNIAALQFCGGIHGARPDGLRLFPFLGRDLVTRVPDLCARALDFASEGKSMLPSTAATPMEPTIHNARRKEPEDGALALI